jgi:hypothetical protein
VTIDEGHETSNKISCLYVFYVNSMVSARNLLYVRLDDVTLMTGLGMWYMAHKHAAFRKLPCCAYPSNKSFSFGRKMLMTLVSVYCSNVIF